MEKVNLKVNQEKPSEFQTGNSKFIAPRDNTYRKIIVKGEFVYDNKDTRNTRILGECSFAVGNVDSIISMLDQIIEQIDHNVIAICEGARFFNIQNVKFTGFPITIENEDGTIFDEIEFADRQRLEEAFTLVVATISKE